jgi:hypothetical protein
VTEEGSPLPLHNTSFRREGEGRGSPYVFHLLLSCFLDITFFKTVDDVVHYVSNVIVSAESVLVGVRGRQEGGRKVWRGRRKEGGQKGGREGGKVDGGW